MRCYICGHFVHAKRICNGPVANEPPYEYLKRWFSAQCKQHTRTNQNCSRTKVHPVETPKQFIGTSDLTQVSGRKKRNIVSTLPGPAVVSR